ncbi:MAG: LuxR C-terminal-related transcriptional regulator [Devosia sp.]
MNSNLDDEAAIIALIHANRIAIWMRDFEAWSECFLHEPFVTRMGWWSQGGVFWRRGWEELSSRLKREMAERPEPNERYAFETKLHDLQVRINGDMAWATYEQVYPGSDIGGNQSAGLTYELRIFERHEERWKIAMIGLLDVGAGRLTSTTIRLDRDGGLIWLSPHAQAALDADDDLVVRNGRLRVRDRGTDTKLQAAIAWAAELDATYMSTQGAVPVVMEAGEGLPTRIWWIIANAGMIHFSFGENQISKTRLDVAALIYGLSPAQKTLAAMVAEGLSLTQIAQRMSIRSSTARTHLDRVFVKTGVRTQTALVRVLLSAASPL